MTDQKRSRATSALRWLEAHRWHALALTLPMVVAIHLVAAAVTIRHSNQDPVASDQGAEMWLAATARDDFLPQRTDGVRHPLWSWIARFAYTEGKQEFFERGKWLNTLICIAFLIGLGVAVTRWLDPAGYSESAFAEQPGDSRGSGHVFSAGAIVLHPALLGGRSGLEDSARRVSMAPCFFRHRLRSGLSLEALGGAVSRGLLYGVCLARGAGTSRSRIPTGALAETSRDWVWRLAIVTVMLVPLAIFSATHFGKPLFNYTKVLDVDG